LKHRQKHDRISLRMKLRIIRQNKNSWRKFDSWMRSVKNLYAVDVWKYFSLCKIFIKIWIRFVYTVYKLCLGYFSTVLIYRSCRFWCIKPDLACYCLCRTVCMSMLSLKAASHVSLIILVKRTPKRKYGELAKHACMYPRIGMLMTSPKGNTYSPFDSFALHSTHTCTPNKNVEFAVCPRAFWSLWKSRIKVWTYVYYTLLKALVRI